VTIGIGEYTRYTCVLVEVESDDGYIGYGEAIARRAPQMTCTAVESLLAPVLLGKDPRDIGALWVAMFDQLRRWGHAGGVVVEAMSGVDTALWDLVGKAEGQPIWRLLHGAGRREVEVYGSSVCIADVETMCLEAARQADRGFPALKVKIGRGRDAGGPLVDVDALTRIREVVAPSIELVVDANGAYDAGGAIRMARHLEALDIGWFEEPVPPDDLDGYQRLRDAIRVPLARGETDFSVFTFRDLFTRRLLDVVQPDLGRCGGITGANQVATLAYAHNVAFAPHTGLSGGISQLAALHVAAAAPTLLRLEHMFIDNPLREIFVGGYPLAHDGFVPVPQAPGLGLEIDEDKIREFARLAAEA
jgi:L-alanine-DL-glutamate epimerase-like enolase superfamily enzyme